MTFYKYHMFIHVTHCTQTTVYFTLVWGVVGLVLVFSHATCALSILEDFTVY